MNNATKYSVAPRRGFKISHKGLILVAIPLAFEIVFVIALLALLKNAENVADNAERGRAIIASSQDILKHFYDASKYLAAYASTHNELIGKQIDQSLSEIPSAMQTLKNEIADQPSELETVRRIEILSNDAVELVQAAKSKIDGRHSLALLGVKDLNTKVAATGEQLLTYIQRIVNNEKGLRRIAPEKKLHSREMVRQAFALGIGINVLTALLLAIYFARQITNRLSIMIDNSNRMADGTELNAPIKGSDEIAELDSVFHQMAASLKLAADKEREVQRLKQEFVRMISHDLKAPLTSVTMTLDMLVDGMYGELNERAQARVATATGSTRRLIALINDLLDLEKLEAGQFELEVTGVDASVLIESSVDEIFSIAQSRGITFEMSDTDAVVLCDGERIVQVLVNLLSNAIKFSPDGSSIALRLQVDSVDTTRVRFEVIDQGRGIPAEAMDLVFDRFKQVERSDATKKKGTGLGLAICKAIVEQHGGTIGVSSSLGQGSTFWFTLPAVPERKSIAADS